MACAESSSVAGSLPNPQTMQSYHNWLLLTSLAGTYYVLRRKSGIGMRDGQTSRVYKKHLAIHGGILTTLEISKVFMETDSSKVTNVSKNSKYISIQGS